MNKLSYADGFLTWEALKVKIHQLEGVEMWKNLLIELDRRVWGEIPPKNTCQTTPKTTLEHALCCLATLA